MYANGLKRLFDFLLALFALLILSPLLLLLTLIGAIAMKGNPFFAQPRPGRGERVFRLYKFRTMSNEKDENGNLLPDEKRLGKYGKFLRATSLDELPSLLNILAGDLALVGPRPLLVRDMVFMTPDERRRHTVRQGLTGLAQVSGRNAIAWKDKLVYDLRYIEHITLWGDIKILFRTVACVFRSEGITEEGMATAADLGDYLLSIGEVTKEEYDARQEEAREILRRAGIR